ncbi:MAG: hypothetical protein U0R49_03155 [Fimbriimonadales bacterium]
MIFHSDMRPERPVPALVGNGTLVTALGRQGCHEKLGDLADTQEFVMAGRRVAGPRHPLIPLGKLFVEVSTGLDELVTQSQEIDTSLAEVRTRREFRDSLESTRSLVLAHKNVFLVEKRIANHSNFDLPVSVRYVFEFGSREGKRLAGLEWSAKCNAETAEVEWSSHDNLGLVSLVGTSGEWIGDEDELQFVVSEIVSPGDDIVVRLAISFSDRLEFVHPFSLRSWDDEIEKHQGVWRDFWDVSEVCTNNDEVDRFREISLYTIACQATNWSVPPTVTEKHWGAGSFHDEWYPFVALISGGWVNFAERIAYARLGTLGAATSRANLRGALFPWSSTEVGEERDPHGHWYSERFHLGQIGGVVWKLWQYEKRSEQLEELYPVLRECARYFELNMLVRDEFGKLQTKACTDFDESVGEVAGGPMTMAAATYLLDRASEAARRLDIDRDYRVTWDRLARELRQNFPVSEDGKRYVVPSGKDQHISTLGYIVPFFVDAASDLAINSFASLFPKLKTEFGFRPGLSPVFDNSAWTWTAGHLALCAATIGDEVSTWAAVQAGPLSAGQFMSPNEHLIGDRQVHVPWFTTGCGAWVAGLHWMFARTDQNGDYVMCGVSPELNEFHFRGLRLSRGVTVSARVSDGKLKYFSLCAPTAMNFTFEIPSRFVEEVWSGEQGQVYDLIGLWRVQVELSPGENQLF